jgi:hypothetical protein
VLNLPEGYTANAAGISPPCGVFFGGAGWHITAKSCPATNRIEARGSIRGHRRHGGGGADDPISALLEVNDSHGNRVDLLIGLRGKDPERMNRTRQVRLAETILEVVGREDFIAVKAFAGGLLGSVPGPRYQPIRSERPLRGRPALWQLTLSPGQATQRMRRAPALVAGVPLRQ